MVLFTQYKAWSLGDLFFRHLLKIRSDSLTCIFYQSLTLVASYEMWAWLKEHGAGKKKNDLNEIYT